MENKIIGKSYPLGCTSSCEGGVKGFNFALYSSLANSVNLCIFRKDQSEIQIPMHRTDDIWHIFVTDVDYGDQYGFRLKTDNEKSFINPNKLMLDPYAKMVVGKPDLSLKESRECFLQNNSRDSSVYAPKAVITNTEFDWNNEKNPNIDWSKTIIYEVHVKGFTKLREDIPEEIRGTYAGLCHPNIINYLKELGITSIELLPINYHLDEVHLQERGLHNYWGYSPLAMFAVESEYSSKRDGSNPLTEFKMMVKTLHNAGIEVILDVVFNHTIESEQDYPTFCQRGIDDKTYYWHYENGDYINWTGCGNMLNLSTNIGRQWVTDCLRYWVEECHVDGFRFDLASVLGRESPWFNQQALLFKEIQKIPSLKNCKFIAEPWDIGEGGYQVGNFPEYFSEWNDRFRDDICKFWLWKTGELGSFAERFAGSSDIYKKGERLPHNSINFITAHDGFTLKDLVSYNQKHNFDNGENNQDGRNENYSYNHDFEGSIGASEIIEKRRYLTSTGVLASLLLANGTPMLLAGDEFGNTQYGNNNAYCQDNEIAWLKWQNFDTNLFELTKNLIALRKKITALNEDIWWHDEQVNWFNVQGNLMMINDWENKEIKAFQILLNQKWLLLINSKEESQNFSLPFSDEDEWDILYSSVALSMQEYLVNVNTIAFVVLQKKQNNSKN